jgi:hypothetical protein
MEEGGIHVKNTGNMYSRKLFFSSILPSIKHQLTWSILIYLNNYYWDLIICAQI